MTLDALRTDTGRPVATITLHRPAQRNAVDGPTADALLAAFAAFEADPALRVAVLTGGGTPAPVGMGGRTRGEF